MTTATNANNKLFIALLIAMFSLVTINMSISANESAPSAQAALASDTVNEPVIYDAITEPSERHVPTAVVVSNIQTSAGITSHIINFAYIIIASIAVYHFSAASTESRYSNR